MHAAKPKPLLASGTFGPNSVRGISDVCDDWFKNGASTASFVFRSVFRDLLFRRWDDPQGVPSDEVSRFESDVLPRLEAVLNASAGTIDQAIAALVIADHSSI